VDGRPNRRNNAAFSNFSGVVHVGGTSGVVNYKDVMK